MPPKAKLHKDNGKRKALPKNPPPSEPQPSTSDDNQAQFEIELLWCIQQLQTAISSGKLNQKQLQDSTKTLSSLTSNSTPVIRKRQLMRLSFGDYRAKMAEEEAKYARRNGRIVYVTSKPSNKSMFVKKAPFLTSGKDFRFNFDTDSQSKNSETTNKPEAITTALESMDINKPEHEMKAEIPKYSLAFHFEPSDMFVKKAPFLTSGKDFRFNFDTDSQSKNSETTNKPEAITTALESMDINKPEHEMKAEIPKYSLAFHFEPSDNVFRFNFSTKME